MSEGVAGSCTEGQVEKHPVDPYPAPFAGTLYLPLNYRQTSGVKKVRVLCALAFRRMLSCTPRSR